MIEIGKYTKLKVAKETEGGLYLSDAEGEQILLPEEHCPKGCTVGDSIEVFVYLNSSEEKVATTQEPKVKLSEFALLQVADVSVIGAFLDWGLDKHILVPFSEQKQKMKESRWYVVRLCLDELTHRLYASNKLNKFLSNQELSVKEREKVDLLVFGETELGYNVIVNNLHKGLIYRDEVSMPLNVGSKRIGYVKQIREENKLDISLKPIGFENYNDDNCQTIIDALRRNEGKLPLNDKTSPEEIDRRLNMSKKAFKKAIGVLYKKRAIVINKQGIELT